MKLDLVVPCYNEEAGLKIFYSETMEILRQLECDYNFIFVNDGSKDGTLSVILELESLDKNIKYIDFSRNFGKEAAILAGLSYSSGDRVVVIDADLQHDPKHLVEMMQRIDEGFDSVATRRVNRKGEPRLRSYFARKFYQLMNRFSDISVVDGAQDYRLMRKCVVDAVLELHEYHRFSKGIFEWVGFSNCYIEVVNRERVVGETSWSFFGLLNYAIEGIIAFTTAPLRFATISGIFISLVSFLYMMQIVFQTIFFGTDAPGYSSTIVIILFLGGIQLISLGLIGEYLAKTYMEIKRRPSYLVKKTNISREE